MEKLTVNINERNTPFQYVSGEKMKKQNSMPKKESPQSDETPAENTASETAESVRELLKAITEINENLKDIRRTVTGGF